MENCCSRAQHIQRALMLQARWPRNTGVEYNVCSPHTLGSRAAHLQFLPQMEFNVEGQLIAVSPWFVHFMLSFVFT